MAINTIMAKKATFKQGLFVPTNPDKYIGDLTKIVFRSSWELEFCKFCDRNVKVLEWASEEIKIPYVKPTDNKQHNYFPDFFVKYQNTAGLIVQELIEVKPQAQVNPPRKNIKNPKQRQYEQVMYAINISKWQAAQVWCKQRNVTFRILTENQLFKG